MVDQRRELAEAIEQVRALQRKLGGRISHKTQTVLDMLLAELTRELAEARERD